jgi:hypothetical protein
VVGRPGALQTSVVIVVRFGHGVLTIRRTRTVPALSMPLPARGGLAVLLGLFRAI